MTKQSIECVARYLWRASALTFCVLLASSVAFAHPMGNFSISHYSAIRVERGSVEIRYLIDMAEIPTFQEVQQTGMVTKAEGPSARAYVAKQAEVFRAGLALTLNGQPLSLKTESTEIIFPEGAGGLPTVKMAFVYRATIPSRSAKAGTGDSALFYRDNNFPSRVGWKEVVASAGPGVAIVNATVPAQDRSSQLSNYPTDLLNSPPLDLEARMSLRWSPTPADSVAAGSPPPGTTHSSQPKASQAPSAALLNNGQPAKSGQTKLSRPETSATNLNSMSSQGATPQLALLPNQQSTPQNRFTQLMTTKRFGIWFLFGAALIAAGLGAMHALEPGHGKTIVAAYLVGSKGTAYHAFLLGLIVTISHTAGVFALGAVTLYASKYIVPDQLYPWMGAISGLLIAALGWYLFLQRFAGREVGHSHGPGGHHHHGGEHEDGSPHAHDGHTHSHEIRGDVSYRQLLALGITGGIVPCPAALVVLLSAVALNRVGFGLFLIVAFSLGLAAVLIAVGMLMVYARQFMTQVRGDSILFTRWLPLTSAAVMTILGLAIAARSLITGGILQIKV